MVISLLLVASKKGYKNSSKVGTAIVVLSEHKKSPLHLLKEKRKGLSCPKEATGNAARKA